jgi:curli biogenesis system outer membrane secretion channel CsgG
MNLKMFGLFQCATVACILVAGCSTTTTIEKRGDPVTQGANAEKVRTPLPYASRIKVAVLDFDDRTDFGRGRLGRSAANVLVTFLSRSGQFALYEREKIDKVMVEQGILATGKVDSSAAVSIGKAVGVDYVFIGAVSEFGYRSKRSQALIFGDKITQQAEATVDVRMIEVATGRIVASESGTGVVTVKTGHVLGVGTSAGYDETTAANALRAAISQYVDVLIDQCLANR